MFYATLVTLYTHFSSTPQLFLFFCGCHWKISNVSWYGGGNLTSFHDPGLGPNVQSLGQSTVTWRRRPHHCSHWTPTLVDTNYFIGGCDSGSRVGEYKVGECFAQVLLLCFEWKRQQCLFITKYTTAFSCWATYQITKEKKIKKVYNSRWGGKSYSNKIFTKSDNILTRDPKPI